MDPYADIRRALEVRRIELGYTKKEVAAIMGYSPSTISNFENGYPNEPSLTMLRRWAQALKADLHFSATLTFDEVPLPKLPRMYDVTPLFNGEETE